MAQAVSLCPLILTICIFFLGIYKYTNTFSLVGGVNLPKKVGCVGTDGIERPQLVKVKYLHTVICTRESVFFYKQAPSPGMCKHLFHLQSYLP
jgi:hypothetical protein